MRRMLRVMTMALAIITASTSARADSPRDVDWNSLLPAELTELRRQIRDLGVEMRNLPADRKAALREIAMEQQIRKLLAKGLVTEDRLRPSQKRILENNPSARFPELVAYQMRVNGLRRELKKLDGATNEDLDGQRIRMSGYLLPLEFDGGAVSEFLLVPYVGACIHVPPPPPNQIVHVTLAGSYAADSVYAPVTVTGSLSSSPGQVDLFLKDGNAMVDLGYRLNAERVEAIETE